MWNNGEAGDDVTQDLNDTGTCDDHDRHPDRRSDEALAERMP